MTDFIEKGLRAIEDQYVLNQDGRRAIAQIRATMYQAEADGHLPRTVEVEAHGEHAIYIHPDFDFHRDLGLVVVGGRSETLTPSENRILGELTANPNIMVSSAVLFRNFRGVSIEMEVDPSAMRVHIFHLRQKLNPDYNANKQSVIKTVRNNGFGNGYMLVDPSRAPFVTPPIAEEGISG